MNKRISRNRLFRVLAVSGVLALPLSACQTPGSEAADETGAAAPPAAEQSQASPQAGVDCQLQTLSQVEQEICTKPYLMELDRLLNQVYQRAHAKAPASQRATLKALQRGWIKGRDACWKAADTALCIEEAYRRRSGELQAQYDLLPARRFTRRCGAEILRFAKYATAPEVIKVQGEGHSFLLFRQAGDGPAVYVGRNETYVPGPPARWQGQFEGPWLECESLP